MPPVADFHSINEVKELLPNTSITAIARVRRVVTYRRTSGALAAATGSVTIAPDLMPRGSKRSCVNGTFLPKSYSLRRAPLVR